MDIHVRIHVIHAGARWVSDGDTVGVVQTFVYTGVHTVQLYTHVYTYMYIHVPFDGQLTVTEFVSCRLMSIYVYLQACTVMLYAHTWTYACTMYIYILYMQVLNGCLTAIDEQSWCPAASVYIYMYLQVCTAQLYAHTWTYVCIYVHVHNICRCSMDVSQLVTDRVGVLQRQS